MDNDYVSVPLVLSGGHKNLVAQTDSVGRVLLAVNDTADFEETSPGALWSLGFVDTEELRHFVTEAMPVSLKTNPLSIVDQQGLFNVEGPYVHIRIHGAKGEQHATLLLRDEFKQLAEGILGPVSVGGFFM